MFLPLSSVNIIWVLLALVVLVIIFIYNSLIRTRNRVREAWSDIEVQLKRRYDLIPNLVNTVKGYASHEQKIFEDVANARASALSASSKDQKAKAESNLSGTLKSLFAVAENYPDLKANQNFLDLQNQLTDTEDKIQAARRFYNNMVMELNTKVQTFPTNILAKIFKIGPEEFFGLESEEEKSPVEVKF
jgi:LemA protein